MAIGPALFGCEHAASAIEDGDTILVAVWRFHGSAEMTYQSNTGKAQGKQRKSQCLYPANASPCTWNNKTAPISNPRAQNQRPPIP